MSRVRRKNLYVPKRERLRRGMRNMKLILIFGGIALVFLAIFRLQAIVDWFLLTF